MADTVTLTLSFPHHHWIRIRAFALANRQSMDDLVTAALREDLHRIGQHDPIPRPDRFTDRLTAATALLAQVDALTAAFTASLHDPSLADGAPVDPTTFRGSILRAAHLKHPPDQVLTIRPKVPAKLWQLFKGYAYVYGREPTQAVTSVILHFIGDPLIEASDPTQPAPVAAALDKVIDSLTQLRREMDAEGFQF